MPPKRRSTGPAAKSQQSTLAFHGASNKVVKPGTRAANAKKNLLTKEAKEEEPAVHDVKVEEEEEEPTTADAAFIKQTEQVEQAKATPEEEAARRVTQKQIAAYWKKQEAENVVPRAHQGDLSVEEKILRKFDMNNQYGPCVGVARLKRWQRAHRLDLDPPIEVLAVLLKEQEGKDKAAVQRSRVDELLNSQADVDSQA